jgi:hypothetical protein
MKQAGISASMAMQEYRPGNAACSYCGGDLRNNSRNNSRRMPATTPDNVESGALPLPQPARVRFWLSAAFRMRLGHHQKVDDDFARFAGNITDLDV